jgi:hypothetical protein
LGEGDRRLNFLKEIEMYKKWGTPTSIAGLLFDIRWLKDIFSRKFNKWPNNKLYEIL